MTTTYYPQLLLSAILDDSDRSSYGDDTNVTNWNQANKFIVATQIGYDGKDTAASTYKLQWRDVSDSGAFDGSVPGEGGDVASTGEIKWSASSAVLADGTAVTTTTRRCTPEVKMTWQNGLESIGDNTIPDAGSFDLGSDYYSELQWGLDPADADYSHVYEFQLWNNTEGAGHTCNLTLTIQAAPVSRRIFITHQ